MLTPFNLVHSHLAARRQDPMVTRQLLRAGADLTARNRAEKTPLLTLAGNIRCFNTQKHEIRSSSIPVLGLILDAGCDLRTKDNSGRTALHALALICITCRTGECAMDAASLLLELGAEIDAIDNDGRTASDILGADLRSDTARFLKYSLDYFAFKRERGNNNG